MGCGWGSAGYVWFGVGCGLVEELFLWWVVRFSGLLTCLWRLGRVFVGGLSMYYPSGIY